MLSTLPKHMSSPPVFNGVRVVRSLVFCLLVCKSLLVLLSFFCSSLYCLYFFNWRLIIASLVSSNFIWVIFRNTPPTWWLTVSSFAVDSRRRSHDGHSPCQAAKCRGVLPYKLQMKSIYIYFIKVYLHIMQNSQLKYNYWLLYIWFM